MGRIDGEDGPPFFEGPEGLPAGSFDLPRPPAGFREEVFRRTARVVRRRVHLRRLGLAIAGSLIFALGLVTGQLFPGNGGPGLAPSPPEAPGASLTAPSRGPREILRQVPDAPPADRPGLLRRAGDSYLSSSGDLEAALDCYRQYLEISTAAGSDAPDGGGTWLLEALKQGRTTQRKR